MKLRYPLFATLLLSLVGLALFQAGCGSSSKKTSNQALDVTTGTWSISISPGSSTMTATFTTFPCSNTNVMIGPSWQQQGAFSTTAAVCVNGGTPTATSADFTPQGLVLGLGANPVPANGTTTLVTGAAYFAQLNSDGVDSDLYDLTGTITASTKSISGSFTCDASCTTCTGKSGTFTGTMN